MAAVRGALQMGLAQAASQLPENVRPLMEIPNLLAAAELTLNLTGPGPTSLVMHANNEEDAAKLETILNETSRKFQEDLKAQLAANPSEDPLERAVGEYALRMTAKQMEMLPKRDGTKFTYFHSDGLDESQKKMLVAGLGMAGSMLGPALIGGRQAAHRAQGTNNLRQMLLSMHVYQDAKGAFPAHANYGADDKPLLSWRVHILPYLDQNGLYQQFHLDEPWDSENNKPLIAQMPDVYKCAAAPLEPGKTNYLAVVGEQCAMNGTKDGINIRNIADGTSNTIMIVEADPAEAVEWTKPDDFEFNADQPNAGLGNVHPGGWNAAFVDGHVQFISNSIDLGLLKALFTAAGGEPIQQGGF
jgi:prepilin-type processing-associated H-X9-DG protein